MQTVNNNAKSQFAVRTLAVTEYLMHRLLTIS